MSRIIVKYNSHSPPRSGISVFVFRVWEMGRMGNAPVLLPLLALAFVAAAGGSTTAAASALFPHSGSGMWAESGSIWPRAKPACNGLIGECYPEEEMLADSESNRRILQTRSYISYQALRANSVPCSQRGTSYYNCRSGGGQANPYTRGCTQITRCARDTS